MKNVLIILFLFSTVFALGQNQYERKKIIIDSLDHKRIDRPYDHLYVVISGGDDQKNYNYIFYLNNKLVDSVNCKMWSSIGRCKCKDGSYASVRLAHSDFNTGDVLKIEMKNGFVEINLRKDYKDLHFSTWGDGYKGLYIRGWGDRPVILE